MCHRLSDHIVLIYQEIHSLSSAWRKAVLDNELKVNALFSKVLAAIISRGEMPPLEERVLTLAAHNISVLGHMWAFRRWMLSRHYTVEEYIDIQTDFILSRYLHGVGGQDPWPYREHQTTP